MTDFDYTVASFPSPLNGIDWYVGCSKNELEGILVDCVCTGVQEVDGHLLLGYFDLGGDILIRMMRAHLAGDSPLEDGFFDIYFPYGQQQIPVSEVFGVRHLDGDAGAMNRMLHDELVRHIKTLYIEAKIEDRTKYAGSKNER